VTSWIIVHSTNAKISDDEMITNPRTNPHVDSDRTGGNKSRYHPSPHPNPGVEKSIKIKHANQNNSPKQQPAKKK
jgi:hypothetical protein